jgi:hypothetical protein
VLLLLLLLLLRERVSQAVLCLQQMLFLSGSYALAVGLAE